MANSILKNIRVNINLNNGTDNYGNLRTVSVTLGKINKDNFDEDKVRAIVYALEPCLSKTVNSVDKVEVYNLY